VDSAFTSDLSYSVTSSSTSLNNGSSGCCPVEEGDSNREDLIHGSVSARRVASDLISEPIGMAGSVNGSNREKGGGVYDHHLLRSYPAPERHVSCYGGTRITLEKALTVISMWMT
jgi:hypothetical protein